MEQIYNLPTLEGNVFGYEGRPRKVQSLGFLITKDPREINSKLTLAQLVGILPAKCDINTKTPTLLENGDIQGLQYGDIIQGDSLEKQLVYITESRVINGELKINNQFHIIPLSQIKKYSPINYKP